MIFPLTSIYISAPTIGGSVQDPNLLGFIYASGPLLVVTPVMDTVAYSYDSLARLTQARFFNATTVVYAYDAMGNRTSVTETCGPGGC